MNHHRIIVSWSLLSIAILVGGCSSERTAEHGSTSAPPDPRKAPVPDSPSVEDDGAPAPDAPLLASAHRPTIPSSGLLVPESRTPEQVSSPAGPDLGEDVGLRARRLLLSREIRDREPVDPATTFAASGERLYAFVELVNTSPEPRTVTIRFEHADGFATGDVTLDVPATVPRWRTWAWSAHVHQLGAWTASVISDGGEQIGRLSFEVE